MDTGNTFLAVFLGSKSSPRMDAWKALSEEERQAKTKEGMAAWNAWMAKHSEAIVGEGGPSPAITTARALTLGSHSRPGHFRKASQSGCSCRTGKTSTMI